MLTYVRIRGCLTVAFIAGLGVVVGAIAAANDVADSGTAPVTEFIHDDPSAGLLHQDAINANVISSAASARVSRNLDLVGRGERNVADATTDVWALDGYAYTGTFHSPCGGEPGAGIWVWDVLSKNNPVFVTTIPSPTGSRSNDVSVAAMNSGDILVHSNQRCGGGPGGFEIYNVDNPPSPVHLASVRIDELNPLSDALFGGLTDLGVHNLWLFTQGTKDYVAATSTGNFDNFRIYDITDPSLPVLVSAWGAEELFDPGVGEETVDLGRVLNATLWLLDGFGVTANRYLLDATISPDGSRAYLANWDAGLVLLDVSDPTAPQLVSVALDPTNGSLDGEVNSSAAWPSEDGTIVVEGEEDLNAWEGTRPPENLTMDGFATPGDPTIPGTAIATMDGEFFETNQTGLTGSTDGASVIVDGGPTFDAVEMNTAAGSPSFADTGTISGNLVWVGRACGLSLGDVLVNSVSSGDIAIARRGDCELDEKVQTVAAAGASAVIVANNQISSSWGGLRIWDYSDPTNPVLASLFGTACSASTSPGGTCDQNGTYSARNVLVESSGSRTFAYVSWHWDGILVVDVTDPYNPVEVARYVDRTGPNDGLANDFWGVYMSRHSPFIYGSDRNGGLYIFQVRGARPGAEP